jgi:TetR/AcrR family transcriptional repressor of nem operon
MKKANTTRDRFVNAASTLVKQRGFSGTSVSDVLRAAGATKGSLYHYFPGKDDLGLAVLEQDRQEFMELLDKSLAGDTPADSLRNFFEAARRKHRKTGFVGGCLWGNTALETSDTSRVFARFAAKVFGEWTDRIEHVIRAGQKAGQFRTDRKAAELASLTVAVIEGGIMQARLFKKEAPLRDSLESLRVLLEPPPHGDTAWGKAKKRKKQ